jgi:hypothetical protein
MWFPLRKKVKEEMDPMFWKEKQLVREINNLLFVADHKRKEVSYMSNCYDRLVQTKIADRYYEMAKSAAKELAEIHEKRL